MFESLLRIFIDVITPVFLIVVIGYLTASKLGLNGKTLTRTCYFIFIPAFVFDIISSANIEFSRVMIMIFSISLVHILMGLLAFTIASLLGKSREMIAAFVMIAVFGNVGNFGLSLIGFRFGNGAMSANTVYFLTVMVTSFVVCVGIAGWAKGGGAHGVISVLKTPSLIVLVPSIIINYWEIPTPLFAQRSIGLLADATIPTMLFTLGVQLSSTTNLKITKDTLIASSIKLIAGPILAALIVKTLGLTGIDAGANIIQSAMPTAILATIIAMEFNIKPEFVTTAVLFTTVASLFTLTLVLGLV